MLLQAGLECIELGARLGEHGLLHFEFFAGDEIELRERRTQHAAEVVLEVFADRTQAFGQNGLAELAGNVFYQIRWSWRM